MTLDRANSEQQLKDKASTEATILAASLAGAESQISSLRNDMEAARQSSDIEITKLRAQLLQQQQQQQTMLAEAAAVDARASHAVEKLTEECNSLQKQQELLRDGHQQLQLLSDKQLKELQAEREKVSEMSLELSLLHKQLSHANGEIARLLITQVCSRSRIIASGAQHCSGKTAAASQRCYRKCSCQQRDRNFCSGRTAESSFPSGICILLCFSFSYS
jgi:hypothetical protein